MFQNGHGSSCSSITRLSLVLVYVLTPTTSLQTGTLRSNTSSHHHHAATRSNLFRRYGTFPSLRRTRRNVNINANINVNSSTRSTSTSTALNMVFTTPSSVIEQASTQILLDDLIDESVRTTARKTVMMHFNPSSGWVSTVI